MASLQFGGGISNMVGSSGGNTFARNGGGAYVKSKPHGTNPQTPAQSIQRSQTVMLAKYYTFTLSDANRALWRTFASITPVVNRLGNTTFLSGQQMFSKMNSQLARIGVTIVDTPPTSTAVGAMTVLTVTAVSGGGGHLYVGNTVPAPGADDRVIYFASPPLNPGVNYVSSALRRIPGYWATTASNIITSAYESVFGALPSAAGQRIFIRAAVQNITNGVTGPMMQATAFWT
jgi:hypothetical protein